MHDVDAKWIEIQRGDAAPILTSSPAFPETYPLSSPDTGSSDRYARRSSTNSSYSASVAGFLHIDPSDFSTVYNAYPRSRLICGNSGLVVPLSQNGGQFCVRLRKKRAATEMMGCAAVSTGKHSRPIPAAQSPPLLALGAPAVFSLKDRENRAATLRRFISDLPFQPAGTALDLLRYTNSLTVVACTTPHCAEPHCVGWKVVPK